MSLLFSAICKTSSDNHFALLHFFFLRMVLNTASCTMLWTSLHSSSDALLDLIPWIYWSPPLVLKNWCFWTVVLEKTIEGPLDCKEIQPVHSEGDQPWDFFGRNDAEAETPVLWPSHVKCWLIGKDSDAGRDWGQEEKGMTEDEMAGWHHWLDRHEFGWTPGVGDGQGGLACCDLWGRKESDTTEWLNWTEASWVHCPSRLPYLCQLQECFVVSPVFHYEKLN